MNETIISDIVRTVVFLLPVLALVWKGSKIASRVDEHEKQINYNHRIVIFLTIKKNRYIVKT